MKIVQCLRPRKVVGLGTAHGNLTANICRESPEAMVFMVNAEREEQSGELITFMRGSHEIGRIYRKYRFEGRASWKRTVDEILESLPEPYATT